MIPRVVLWRVTYRDVTDRPIKSLNVYAPTKTLARLALREAWLGQPLETYQSVITRARRVTYYRTTRERR